MSTYRVTVEVDVYDNLLAQHDGSKKPPPNDVHEWYGGDLVAAVELGLAEVIHDELEVVSVNAS